ncbi:thioredoxin [Syngnathoides biaculeatus]|uniref:thioredoxin n=1 Tax=Syngnathoides biaculeatus TaxID=300417 RepID=UPI002ADE3091|nr:thioredoxin [Syngnathoides biaculeatus]
MVIVINNSEEFDRYLQENRDKLIVVDFTATWCGPCKMIGPAFDKASENAAYANVIFLKVDVDKCEDISAKCKISCMPTFIFFKNGEQIDIFSGANEAKLIEKLDALTKQ